MVTDQHPGPRASESKIQELERRILTFLRDELLGPEETVERDDDLLSGEILDSIAVVRLGAFVEEEFQIVVQPTDFVIENFQNVALLAAYVHRAANHGGHPSSGSGG